MEEENLPTTPNAAEVRIQIDEAGGQEDQARVEERRRHMELQQQLQRERDEIDRLYDDSAINRRPVARPPSPRPMLAQTGGPMSIQDLRESRYGIQRSGFRPAFAPPPPTPPGGNGSDSVSGNGGGYGESKGCGNGIGGVYGNGNGNA